MNSVKLILELSKPIISLAVAFSTLTAYVLSSKRIDLFALFLVLGIFCFASFASILNQIQEWKYDKLMNRTSNRAIPSNRISIKGAYLIAFAYAIMGSFFFTFFNNLLIFLLVLITLLFYNFIYTPLKRISVISILPGAVVGSIPPTIGWAAGNGSFANPVIWVLALFFFMGQIPHFALLSLRYGKEFKAAGYPVITNYFSRKQIQNISFIWIFAVGFIALILALKASYLYYLILGGFIYLAVSSFLWKKVSQSVYQDRKMFLELNFFYLLVMIVLCMQVFIL